MLMARCCEIFLILILSSPYTAGAGGRSRRLRSVATTRSCSDHDIAAMNGIDTLHTVFIQILPTRTLVQILILLIIVSVSQNKQNKLCNLIQIEIPSMTNSHWPILTEISKVYSGPTVTAGRAEVERGHDKCALRMLRLSEDSSGFYLRSSDTEPLITTVVGQTGASHLVSS